VTYVATAPDRPDDDEWGARIAAHRARRPPTWHTTETTDLESLLAIAPNPMAAILIEDVPLWLTAELDAAGAWPRAAGEGTGLAVTDRADAERTLAARIDGFVAAWEHSRVRVVAVTAEVGWGVVPPTAAGRLFRDQLGLLNQRLAAAADAVWLVTAGIPVRLR
jgi:adenosylcobinamide kinase/adenosylcobinamide-phosphate guanylyltransferase